MLGNGASVCLAGQLGQFTQTLPGIWKARLPLRER